LLSLVCSVVSFSQEEVSVSDFRYPETRALDWKGGLFGNLGSNEYAFSDPLKESSSNLRRGDFFLNTAVLYFHSTENHDNLMRLNASLSYQQSTSKSDLHNLDGMLENKSNEKRGFVTGSWEYRHYPFRDEDVHFIGSANLTYNGYRIKENTLRRSLGDLYSLEIVQKSFGLLGTGFVGIGYGRMRDGTFVIRALRILERLQEDGVVTESLSRDQILKIVDRVAHTREYTTNFERYEKYLVLDIVNELAAEGVALPQAVAPFSILKITEALREQIEPRFFGWRVYYAFGGREQQNYFVRTWSSSYLSQWSEGDGFTRDRVFIHRFAAEYGHAVSQWTHLNADATLDVPTRVSSKFFTIRGAASAIHQIGERIDVVGSYEFQRSAGNDRNSANDRYYTRRILHRLNATFRLFLEDRVSFTTSCSFDSLIEDVYDATPFPSNDNSSQHSSGFGLSFGIGYNII
jgi:hypothetical protein